MDITLSRFPPIGHSKLNNTCLATLGTIITIIGTSVMTSTAATMTVATNISIPKDMCLLIKTSLPLYNTIARPFFDRLTPVTLVMSLQK